MALHKRFPPLYGLRAFEVAARHMSFTRAASELCVTNAAVSHQIKQLEEFLGMRLFDRRNNQLLLTGAGENYLPHIREAFSSVQQATAQLLEDPAPPLRIGVPPSFGARWLVPRLTRLFAHHPALRVEVFTDAGMRGVSAVDLLVTELPQTVTPGLNSECLASTPLVPVCSPTWQARLSTPAALADATLLHERAAPRAGSMPGWREWFEAAGLNGYDKARSLVLGDAQMTLQAALDGQGIALAPRLLVEPELATGRLIQPFPEVPGPQVSYYLAYADHKLLSEDFALLHGWLEAEMGRLDA
ncbi:LysR substrate-binding domain-containing protein [Niveibacterium sp. SC-1]|uniref:LysR substrate-binding domain-containing protein n=1 Tax=Niveibacterium sp. SC-1 TaxID=3135646 RepID=UPI003120015A